MCVSKAFLKTVDGNGKILYRKHRCCAKDKQRVKSVELETKVNDTHYAHLLRPRLKLTFVLQLSIVV